MRRIAAALLLVFATGQVALAQSGNGAQTEAINRGVEVAAQVLAAERAFDEQAAGEGQWTAFRATAAADAVMFVPQMVNAQTWLAGRADPPASVRWQPHDVFVSCDGQLAATSGYAQWPDGSHSRFRTIWQRQLDGNWKWVLDAGWPVSVARPAPAQPNIRIANCERPPPSAISAVAENEARGGAPDGSLKWLARVDGEGRGVLVLWGWNGRFLQMLSSDTMGSPQP